jgi:hypothetical protein
LVYDSDYHNYLPFYEEALLFLFLTHEKLQNSKIHYKYVLMVFCPTVYIV